MRKTIYQRKDQVQNIIQKCDICFIGMIDLEGGPYVLPFNFGMDENHIYLHSRNFGKKNDILAQNPKVCIAFSTDHELRAVNNDIACSYSMRFRSALVFGKVHEIEDYDQKIIALNHIMDHYTNQKFSYNKPAVLDVSVFRVDVDRWEAKESGF